MPGENMSRMVVGGVELHNLFSREIRPERNWHELITESWQNARTYGGMLGILHRGFSVSMGKYRYEEKDYDEIDRLIFYFNIADGWNDHYGHLLKLPNDSGETRYFVGNYYEGRPKEEEVWELRRNLALKSFDMLCQNFFKGIELRGGGRLGTGLSERWERVVVTERLFPVIQNFFRIECEYDSWRVRNLNDKEDEKLSHNEKFAVQFILNLAGFIWVWQEHEIESWLKEEEKAKIEKHNQEMRSRLDASKPWMVEVLARLGKWDVLKGVMLELNEACLAVIKKIALESKLNNEYGSPKMVEKSRLVANLDEARFTGSKAAWFLAERELRLKELKRLKAIVDALRAKDEAEQNLKKLTGRK